MESEEIITAAHRKKLEELEPYLTRYCKFRQAQGLGIVFGIDDLTADEVEAFSIIHQKIVSIREDFNGRRIKTGTNT